MHYQVIDPEGKPSNILSIDVHEKNSSVATVTANQEGTAIILVTYDAMTNMQGQSSTASKRFSAIWPENTGVIVVTVDADGTAIQTNMTINEGMNASIEKLVGHPGCGARSSVLCGQQRRKLHLHPGERLYRHRQPPRGGNKDRELPGLHRRGRNRE